MGGGVAFAAGSTIPRTSTRKPDTGTTARPTASPLPLETRRRCRFRCPAEPDDSAEDLDRRVVQLNVNLDEAVAEERYNDAAKFRDELREMHSTATVSVLSASLAFYEAYGRGDMKDIESMWLDADQVSCVHPLTEIACGFDNVMTAWNNVVNQHGLNIRVTTEGVKVVVNGATAWVTCTEKLEFNEGQQGVPVQATTIWQRRGERWKMVHYHASLMPVTLSVEVQVNVDDDDDDNSQG